MKFVSDEGRGNLVIPAPDEENRFVNLAEVIAEVMPDGGFGGCDDADGFIAVVDGIKDFVDQFFGSNFGAEESALCFFTDKFAVAPFGEAGAHSAFEEAGATGQDYGVDFLGVMEHKEEGDMTAERISEHMNTIVAFVFDEIGNIFDEAHNR